jgi:hypothetical protein
MDKDSMLFVGLDLGDRWVLHVRSIMSLASGNLSAYRCAPSNWIPTADPVSRRGMHCRARWRDPLLPKRVRMLFAGRFNARMIFRESRARNREFSGIALHMASLKASHPSQAHLPVRT